MSVSRPPLAGVNNILCWMHLVTACVLLDIILYHKNLMNLVDLVVVNLVSCMLIMVGMLCE